jgi:biopolymer transport protein ExbD
MRRRARQQKRQPNKLNTSGIADIAFLALIFFLVTSSKAVDQGISARLPGYNGGCCHIECFIIKKRNKLRINIHEEKGLLVNNKRVTKAMLRGVIMEFITNPKELEIFSEGPNRAIVYFYYDKKTSYNDYLTTLNEIKGAYHEIWNTVALERFGYHYKHLNKYEKRSIKNDFPEVIAEIDLTYWKS